MTRITWLALAALLVSPWSLAAPAAAHEVSLVLSAGDHDRPAGPVSTTLWLTPAEAEHKVAVLQGPDGQRIVGQLTAPSLLSTAADKEGRVARELTLIAPALKKGQTLALRGELTTQAPAGAASFRWQYANGKYAELSLGDRPVLRYMHERVDDSSAERRAETFKVYHHVYDPQGERFVTKGAGGLFPHHRGLFYGFNRISYGGQQADTWHCNRGESQTHEKELATEVGPVLGRHRVEIAWRGRDGQPFATETREMTAYNTPGGVHVEFASRLESLVGPVRLDGDPQHAGFQFRASQEVPDKTASQTYYIRPDGKDKPGSFRNWPGDKGHADLAWHALSFVLGDTRYTCCYLDRPENPKESRFSERNYGRFGSYFEYDLDKDRPLELNYRVWLQAGELSVDDVAAQSRNFVEPAQLSAQ